MHEPLTEAHISRLVVHCRPEKQDAISQAINKLQDTEVSLSDPSGKLVVLLEGEHEKDILNTIKQIEIMDGILSASMVFHQIDK